MLAYSCYGCKDAGCEYCQPEKIEWVICPFCKEKDFTLQGLKGHLLNKDCESFYLTPYQHKGQPDKVASRPSQGL